MPFQKGKSGNPKGRKPGKPNKATTDFKEAVTRLLNEADVEKLLKAVPVERRLDLLGRLAEYAFPKLGRTEIAGDQDKPVRVKFGLD